MMTYRAQPRYLVILQGPRRLIQYPRHDTRILLLKIIVDLLDVAGVYPTDIGNHVGHIASAVAALFVDIVAAQDLHHYIILDYDDDRVVNTKMSQIPFRRTPGTFWWT
jgi:hypothetical protein